MPNENTIRIAQLTVDRVYTATADDRQRAMGLAYVTAERADLATEMARFAELQTAPLMAALSLALAMLEKHELPDSRAVSDEFVAIAAVHNGDASDDVMAVIHNSPLNRKS